jgi:hypothetical protein
VLRSLSLSASICLSIEFQFLNDLVQLVEACVPVLAVPLYPCRLFFQPASAELAGSHAPDLFRSNEPCPLQYPDVLFHARERHMELLGEIRHRGVRTPETFQNAASGGVRERSERSIQLSSLKLNHMVQYTTLISGAQAAR